ncbi:transmembrane GTPase fzo1 [Colletotrichum karsti]|uniref:Transmembrane GTPase fzo1 n=1 Tax=Colletotrichum karsti TaxID=1095194 RepID=A0A9P6LMX3_9PEZI|nr:transmembrane GTPase fzo1 [Colletotrichum karsti]KAF9877952.1 transmembrane GTPase fzo1 [Colletotrichum karsti]
MSQDYFSKKGKAPMDQELDRDDSNTPPQSGSSSSRPHYMTVGSGSTSVHAAHLQELLDNDSGYGGSIANGEALASAADRHIPTSANGHLSEADRKSQAGAIHQLWYNSHRVKLGRSINQVIELLKDLQKMNVSWPAHYPSVREAEAAVSSRPGMGHAYSTVGDVHPSASSVPTSPTSPPQIRRSLTSIESAESSRAQERRPAEEPRLVTPQIAQDFSVLKLDLKLGSLHQAELVHSLERGSIASLLDGKISSSIRHLLNLRERIEDTSSKVLVTGDLNAGKSTFCNALLRRKILPEDQQPCTAIFCEVLDARENGGLEEVHAVHKDATYDRLNESTYDVYKLSQLEDIVIDNDKYTQCKVYVKDVRTIDESLLNNGVVDIALIDAPGLNSDTTKTTAVFARQEEIDVVVFVVSAANHFTMTAKEFIWAAAAEKAYLFIVVNGYDNIRDKNRCQKMILDQVHGLSPRTHKESSELVHFVSSNAVPTAPAPPGGPSGGGSGSSSGGGGGDDPGNDPKGKGKDKEKIRDFENLEQSLRRFVLEKRARSKLAPAKHYLLNILKDVNELANVNTEVAQSELDRVTKELREIEPQLESSRRARAQVSDDVNKITEDTCKEVYDYTRLTLNSAIEHAGDNNHGVPYRGIFSAFDYAEELKEAMMSYILDSVAHCEEHAKSKTVGGVNAIKQLGILHLGNDYQNLTFRPDVMFKKKKDSMARRVDIPTEFWDFVDWNTIIQKQEKVAGTGMALTVAGALVPRMIGGSGWLDHALSAAKILGNDNLRRLIIPGIVAAAFAAAAYILNQIPNSLPHRLSAKIAAQLEAIDYVHGNSTRISSSVRKVLSIPADNLRVGLEQSVKDLSQRREETLKVKQESEVALKYFGNLVRNSAQQRSVVDSVDLEAPPPGAVAAGLH